MKPAPFRYERPDNLEAALAMLGEHGEECRILAGGQSLVAMMNTRLVKPSVVIDIGRLPSFDTISRDGDTLVIGALARHSDVAASAAVRKACPLMSEAYPHVSHLPIRNRGTLAGNLAHADPASEMPAVMLVAGGSLTLRSSKGERRVPAADFFLGPFETAARPDELVTEVRIPAAPEGQGWGFHEFSPRKGDFALVAVAATLSVSSGRIQGVALASAGIGPHARRLKEAETALAGAQPGPDAFSKAAALEAAAADPQEDYHADAAYRRDLLEAMVRRALADAHDRCAA